MKVEVAGRSSGMPGDRLNMDMNPMYLKVAAVSPLIAPETATLAVLEELSGTLGDGNAKITITFEINSPKAYEMYNVVVETYHDGTLYDTFDMAVEAGHDIPNTHALTLGSLKDGHHETHFSLNNERDETQGATTVYRFKCVGGIIRVGADHAVRAAEDSPPSVAFAHLPDKYRSFCTRAFAESSHYIGAYGHCRSFDGSTTAEDSCDADDYA
jgi:hypothetical protein